MNARRWGSRRYAIALTLTLIPLAGFAGPRIVAVAAAIAPVGASPKAYVISEFNASNVYAVDTSSNTTVATVTMTASASALAITPDARYVLVVETGFFGGASAFRAASFPGQSTTPLPRVVEAIDTSSNSVLSNNAAPVGVNPLAIAIAPDGSTAYVVDGGSFCSSVCPGAGITPVSIGAGGKLTAGTDLALAAGHSPVDAAVSPDGRTLYVLSSNGWLDALPIRPGGNSTSVPVDATGVSLVLSPDGSTAYASFRVNGFQSPPPTPGVDEITLGAGPKVRTVPIQPSGQGHVPGEMAISTTPAGKSTLWVADQQSLDVLSLALPLGANPAPGSADLSASGAHASNLFATPDGAGVWLSTGFQPALVLNFATGSGKLNTCYVAPVTCPQGTGPIAVTPDQRPVASFVAITAGPGQPASFDASGSTIAFGTIARYDWDFGDGSTQQATGPTTTHTYAAGGTYTVSLTETDWAGTSVSPAPPSTVFTGQTMTRRGGPEARTAHQITIPRSPTPSPTVPTPTPSPTPTPPGFTPKITLLPKVGPPGTVVAVNGTGFPPNTPLTLAWQPGIGTAGVTTSGAGTFTNRFVLVFPKDRLGDRQMVAQPFAVTATFLVVEPPLSPGSHDLLLLFGR